MLLPAITRPAPMVRPYDALAKETEIQTPSQDEQMKLKDPGPKKVMFSLLIEFIRF